MKDLLMIIGGCTILVGAFFVTIVAADGLKELVRRIRRNYQIKHRFDKPPTAKCYCRDCVQHNNESKRCCKFDGWYTADCWFCWDAEPREKEETK
jgi:hypothetical protein